MVDKQNAEASEQQSKGKTADPSNDGEGQALQINENTIEDPETPDTENGDDDLHGRTDQPERDQAIQINENTIDDPNP